MKISDFCQTAAGGTPLKSNKEFYEGGKIPWLLSGEVGNKEITSTKNFITDAGLKGSSAKVFPANTVVVAMYGATAGEVGILKFEAATNQAVCGIYPNDRIIPEYLYYFFQFNKEALVAQAVGNAQPNISQQKIKNTEIPLPCINEQKRIVAALDQAFGDIDKVIDSTKKSLACVKELFDTVLESLLILNVSNNNKIKLGEACTFKHGFAFKSDYFTEKSKFTLLTPGNFLEDGGYKDRKGKQKYYDGPFPPEFLLAKGDLLVAMTEQAVGLLGAPAIVPDDNSFLHNQRLGLVEITSKYQGRINNEYLFHVFNTKYFRRKVQESASGVKVRHTSPKKMQEIEIHLPNNIALQEEISSQLNQLKIMTLDACNIYNKKIELLEKLRKSILHKTFTEKLTQSKGAAA